MAEDARRNVVKKDKSPRRPKPNLNNSRERSASQERLIQDGEDKESAKISRARQRTRARFESLLQAAAQEEMNQEAEKGKKKRRTKTAETVLSELKSGKHIMKEKSKSEERLLENNLYTGDSSPKFKKKRAQDVLKSNEDPKRVELPENEDESLKPKGQRGLKSKKKKPKAQNDAEEPESTSDKLENNAGKENMAYEASPDRQNVEEAINIPRQKKKKKKQNRDAANDAMITEHPPERQRKDDGYLLCIQIHKADRLKPDICVHHPCVKVHIVDVNTGQYVKKSNRQRNVTSFFEGENQLVDFIMPMMTQPFDFRKQRTMVPNWEDVLIYNEIYSYFLQREDDDPEVVIIFEIIDFLSMQSVAKAKAHGNEQGWYNIAWAFLKVVGASNCPNTDKKVRLQLYQPSKRPKTRHRIPGALEVFQWWKSTDRVKYPSTLYVTVKGIRPPDDIDAATRSMFPIQQEKGAITFQELSNTLEGSNTRKVDRSDKKNPIWNHLPGQANRIPNKLSLILPTGRKGCTVARFSHDGRSLACGCAGVDGYPILLYEIPSGKLQAEFSGHFGIAYDMSWTTDGKELLSASSDGTVRSWDVNSGVRSAIKLYSHPSFVYTARHHPSAEHLIVTGGYDQVIRVWSKMTDNLNGRLLRQLSGHSGFVNAIAFQLKGDEMYSADSNGVIVSWSTPVPGVEGRRKSKPVLEEDAIKSWQILRTIKLDELRNTPINSMRMHPSGRKLLVHPRDSFIRMLDLRSSSISKRYLGAVNSKEHIRSTTSTCGSFVISGSEDGTAHVWNADNGDPVYIYSDLGYTNAVSDVDFHPQENMIVFCSFGAGHPVLVYTFDIEVQKRSTIMHTEKDKISQPVNQNVSLNNTTASLLSSKQRPLSYAADGSGIEKEQLRAERVRQKIDSVLNSTDILNTTPVKTKTFQPKESVRFKDPADTMYMTWGSDFSTYKPNSPIQPKTDRLLTSPHAQQYFGASRRTSYSPNSDLANLSAARQSPVASPMFGTIEAQVHDSPLTMSQLQKSAKPVFSFNAGAAQRRKSMQQKQVVALYPYQPNRADELLLKPNDVITVLFQDNDNWWMGELADGRQGYFPASYVVEQEEDLKEISQTVQQEDNKKVTHSAVVSKDGDLKIISAPEDSEAELGTQRRKNRRKRAKRLAERNDSIA